MACMWWSKSDKHVKLLLPLVKATKIQFGAMCYWWIIMISYWVNHGCTTKHGNHGMCYNTNTFVHGGKQVTFHPKKPEPPKKGSKGSVMKEALHVHHVYRGNVKKNRVWGQTLFQFGGNDAATPISRWKESRGPYVEPKEIWRFSYFINCY